MRIIFIGDVVGSAGCEFLSKNAHRLAREYKSDFMIVNGENSAVGNGLTKKTADYILRSGADCITTGNHCFQRYNELDVYDNDNILRPANYPEGNPGHGVYHADLGKYRICVINIQGTAFLDPLDNPFAKIDNILSNIDEQNIFVDFHAESTAEKQAMGYFLNGRVTAVLGTHTHVQTADEKILSKGTAYITDAGMCGAKDSILGDKIKPCLDRFIYRYAERFEQAEGKCILCGVCIDFNEKSGKATGIERIQISE